jgi:hypothetical protein
MRGRKRRRWRRSRRRMRWMTSRASFARPYRRRIAVREPRHARPCEGAHPARRRIHRSNPIVTTIRDIHGGRVWRHSDAVWPRKLR